MSMSKLIQFYFMDELSFLLDFVHCVHLMSVWGTEITERRFAIQDKSQGKRNFQNFRACLSLSHSLPGVRQERDGVGVGSRQADAPSTIGAHSGRAHMSLSNRCAATEKQYSFSVVWWMWPKVTQSLVCVCVCVFVCFSSALFLYFLAGLWTQKVTHSLSVN